jgi:hypothetical protein
LTPKPACIIIEHVTILLLSVDLQTDPVGYKDSANLYIYVGNNPVIRLDPYGLCASKQQDSIWVRNNDYSLEETHQLLEKVENPVWYIAHGGPLSHAIPRQLNGLDFKTGNETFVISVNGKEETLNSSDFGNYVAGYAGTYYGGYTGLGLVLEAGDYFARKEGLTADDQRSVDYIIEGHRAAGSSLEHQSKWLRDSMAYEGFGLFAR